MSLRTAKRRAFFWYRKYANGIDIKASMAIIIANIITHSWWVGYPIMFAMGLRRSAVIAMNSVDVEAMDISVVLYTRMGLSQFLSLAKRKKPVSIP